MKPLLRAIVVTGVVMTMGVRASGQSVTSQVNTHVNLPENIFRPSQGDGGTRVGEPDGFNFGSAYLSAGSRIRVADSDPVNPEANPAAYSITGNTITVEAWIFPMGAPPHDEKDYVITRPYYSGNLVEPYQAYELCIDNTGATDDPRIEFVISDGLVPGNWGRVRDVQQVSVGEWTHVAGTYDGANVRLYINGALVSSTPFSANIGAGNAGLYIGGLASSYFNGLIDEVRLWNICRSQTQIETYQDSTLYGTESGLAGNWPLDKDTTINGKSPVTIDRTANHNDLWVQWGARFVGTVPAMEPSIAPEFSAPNLPEAVVGQAWSFRPAVFGWPPADLLLVAGPEGMTYDPITRTVHWTPSSAQIGSADFEMSATNSAGSASSTLSMWVYAAPTQFVAHNNNDVKLFVGNNGMLGRDSTLGGFELNGMNGLFEADLLIARSASQVSGALYSREYAVQTAIRPVTSALDGFDQAYEASYNDQRSGNPLGVSVVQRSHSKSTPPDRRYVILEYVVTNTSGTALSGLYVGLGLDLDVGNPSNNLCAYDAARSLAYAYEADGTTNPYYYGVAAVMGTISGYAFPAPGTVPTEADYYQSLTTSGGAPTATGDQRVVLGCGPYNIPVAGSARVMFAMVTGTNLVDLQTNADAAHAVQFRPNPTISSIRDVPNDQGGHVTLRWNASPWDDLVHNLPYYSIWRSIPESAWRTVTKTPRVGTAQDALPLRGSKAMTANGAGTSALPGLRYQLMNGVEYAWEWIANQPAHRFTTYSYTAPTLYDSMSTTSGKHYFLVSAQTSDPFVYYDSNPDSGYSVDNLAPESPQNPLLTALPQGPICLAWSRNRVDPDVASYAVYHSTTSGFPLADSTRFWSTVDTTLTDSTPVAGKRYYYRITTIDIHGNESAPTVQLGEEALPIQLAGFTAVVLNGQLVRLDWITLTETNNYGFEVQKSADSTGQFQLIPNSFTPGHGTTLEPHHYVFIDSSARAGRWWYRLKQIDLDGTIHCTDPVCVTIWTEISGNRVPAVFALRQNYPNPFNPATSFQFSIAHCQLTILKVYDALGREVATLVNEVKQPGVYTVPWDAGGVAGGVYFYRLQAGSYVEVKRLVLLR